MAKPTLYKTLRQAVFDAAVESLDEFVRCRDIDGESDPDTLRAMARFYALLGVIEESGNYDSFVEFLSTYRRGERNDVRRTHDF